MGLWPHSREVVFDSVIWAIGAAGSASDLHSEGQRFESVIAHHMLINKLMLENSYDVDNQLRLNQMLKDVKHHN